MTSPFDRLRWFGAGDRRLLRRELHAIQQASVDEFVFWWSHHIGERSDVTFERRGLRLVARERGAPTSAAQELYDLAATGPHWRARMREVVARLSTADVSLPALETGPVFGLETNARPERVGDTGYVVLVNQGWIQLGYWIAQVLAVTDAGGDDESASRADRILRSLPRVATSIVFDDSLALDEWLPDPLPVEDFNVQASEIQSYVAQGEAFIFLHEFAHIVHGHLDQLEELHASNAPAAEVAAFRRRCELEADRTGTKLLLAAAPHHRVDDGRCACSSGSSTRRTRTASCARPTPQNARIRRRLTGSGPSCGLSRGRRSSGGIRSSSSSWHAPSSRSILSSCARRRTTRGRGASVASGCATRTSRGDERRCCSCSPSSGAGPAAARPAISRSTSTTSPSTR